MRCIWRIRYESVVDGYDNEINSVELYDFFDNSFSMNEDMGTFYLTREDVCEVIENLEKEDEVYRKLLEDIVKYMDKKGEDGFSVVID